jgi:putative PIN family toxin of toxin-antitoxin system
MRRSSDPPRVVADTNRFVSGTILRRGNSFALLTAWQQGRFALVLSRWQRREIDRALRKPKLQQRFRNTRRERDAVLRRIDQTAEFVSPLPILPLTVRDANDEKILGAALAGQVDYLVTGDHDLLVLAGDPRLGTVQIVTVARFLETLDEGATHEAEG